MAYTRILYGLPNGAFNYSKFICDTEEDVINLPTNLEVGYSDNKKFETCAIGSVAETIEEGKIFILSNENKWEFFVLRNFNSNEISDMNEAITKLQEKSNQTVGMQDKTNPTGEVFNDYQSNTATGDYSHAEGTGTTASENSSHAEGYYTKAKGTCSHAEGFRTTASGGNSHAEGDHTQAAGSYSHAEGLYTIAASSYQHVQGRYNIVDSTGKFAFIIGNGTSSANRSNALAIDWEGKIYINNSSVGIDLNNLLTRLEALENK